MPGGALLMGGDAAGFKAWDQWGFHGMFPLFMCRVVPPVVHRDSNPTQKTAGYHPVAIENGLFVDDFPSYKTRFVADLPLLGLITRRYLEK